MRRASETMMPPFTKTSEVARFNLSAKMVNLSALPSPLVSSQILTDRRLAGLACLRQAVRIIKRFNHPRTPTLIPRHVDGLHDIGLRGEELQLEIRRCLRVTHAVPWGQRRLILHRLWPTLAIRHLARQTLQGTTRGEEGFPR